MRGDVEGTCGGGGHRRHQYEEAVGVELLDDERGGECFLDLDQDGLNLRVIAGAGHGARDAAKHGEPGQPFEHAPLEGVERSLPREQVHWVDVPVTEAVAVITRWGAGTGRLVKAMR